MAPTIKSFGRCSSKSKHFCAICNSFYGTIGSLKKHDCTAASQEKTSFVKCHPCNINFAQKGNLKRHEAKFHTCLSCSEYKKSEFKALCVKCRGKFASFVDIENIEKNRIHAKRPENMIQGLELEDGPGVCPYCNVLKTDLKYHLEEQTDDKILDCDQCTLTVTKKFCLVWHKSRVHSTKEPNHLCGICNVAFLNRENLALHVYIVHWI